MISGTPFLSWNGVEFSRGGYVGVFSGLVKRVSPLRVGGGGLMRSRVEVWRRRLSRGARFVVLPTAYGLRANRVSEWRRPAKDGKLVLPAADGPLGCAPPVLCDEGPRASPSDAGSTGDVPSIEIAVGDVMIRLDAGTSAARIAEIVRAVGRAT